MKKKLKEAKDRFVWARITQVHRDKKKEQNKKECRKFHLE